MPASSAAAALVVGSTAAAGPALSLWQVDSVKAVVATLGAALLLMRALPACWQRLSPGLRRLWDGSLLLLGALGAICWVNLFQFNFPGFGHPSETFHYYMGAKYFQELGYTRLYRCTAIADAEAGLEERVGRRRLRNLETNALERAGPVLDHPADCTRHFRPARWRSFQRDLAWFRDRPTPNRWHVFQTDHGYNATPVWGLFGGLLSNTGPTTDGQILALRLLDPLLLLVAWSAVAVSFGWRTLCVALLFWGTSYPLQYGWIGGSYLRQLELAAVLVGICCLRRSRAVAGGYLLALAALVRIYPVLLLGGPLLQGLGSVWRERRLALSPAQRRLLLGGLLAAFTLLPLAALTTGSLRSWTDFADNSRVLLGTPVRNHMGLRTTIAYDHGSRAQVTTDGSLDDPYARWKQARGETFAKRRPLFVALVAGFVVLLGVAVRGQPLWVATVLGAGLVPIAAELTCYYSAILVVFALLWERHPAVGAALVGLSALGWALVERFHFYDVIFAWYSLAAAFFVVFATVWARWARPVPDPASARRHPRGS
jgi:hypothetical protein